MIEHATTVLHPDAPPETGNPYPRFAVGGPREWKKAGDQMPTSGKSPKGDWDDDHDASVTPDHHY
jgi:hypothetical protein